MESGTKENTREIVRNIFGRGFQVIHSPSLYHESIFSTVYIFLSKLELVANPRLNNL